MYKKVGNDVVIFDVKNFNIFDTFMCGQCFRFNPISDDTFIGIVNGAVLEITQKENFILFKNITLEKFEKICVPYFDLKRDYSLLKCKICIDITMEKSYYHGCGIRILKQDYFECLISFIISANNNIPRIKKIVEKFCTLFGTPIEYNNSVYFSFPTAKSLSDINENDLSPISAGFRAKYIVDAIQKSLLEDFSFQELNKLPTNDLRKKLMQIKGVGPKVADCVMLFAFSRFEVFPVDVWVKKSMLEYYNISDNLSLYATEMFGEYSGLAQQYLFHYIRNKKPHSTE